MRLWQVSFLWRRRAVAVCLCLIAVGAVLAVFLLASGKVRLSPAEVLSGLRGMAEPPVTNRLITQIRLPRLITAALVGAALGLAGAVFQSLSRNALGSPDIIGFTTGAATGAIAQIILFNAGPVQTALAAVASGVMTALVVLALSHRPGSGPGGGGTAGGYRLILIGIGMGALMSGLNTLLMVTGDLERAMSAQIWLAGSLAARDWSHVLTALTGVLLFAPLVLANGRQLMVMEMGEDMARQLGVHTGRARLVLVLASVGLTSVAVASAGPIAFVALAGPQLARGLTRSPDVPLISGALAGAVLLMAADLIGQNAPFGLAMPIGLTTGFLGGLYLIALILFSRRV
nr:iron chelate uptake ABC transporter family permease subunit [Pseudogemmobacter hezensis]